MMRLRDIICLLTLLVSTSITCQAQNTSHIDLNGDWRLRQSGSTEWSEAVVPGCVQSDLMAAGAVKDPFYGLNERDIHWVAEKDWEYRHTFTLTEDDVRHRHISLVMEGIDTYADVMLNGQPIVSCDNMFRTWREDVKELLHSGENTIDIYFHSVFKIDIPKYLAAPYKLQAWPNNDQGDMWLSLYARKAGYNYGWDWGPRIITAGVWKPIYLELWDDIKIDCAHIRTVAIDSERKADMKAVVAVIADKDCKAVVKISDGKKTLASRKIELSAGENNVDCDFIVRKPRLWWSNGLGKQNLYDFTITVETAERKVSMNQTTGIRTIEILRKEDSDGRSMAVRLNGIDVFAKGANLIPLDNFPARITPERYEYIVASAAKANMNMLRVWGGGLYESDSFYQACDRYGIMVWQDMTFACGMFPADSAYVASVEQEVKDNVVRLRNHPSLALWCGNNENEISYYAWGWQSKLTREQDSEYRKGMDNLFRKVIPDAIAQVDPTRYYHPSSPITGYNGVNYSMGDVHYWSVWKGASIEDYAKTENIGRFMSEYGFQSLPCSETIEHFATSSDHKLDSPVMLAHQKAYDDVTRDPNFGYNMITRYMDMYFGVPDDFDDKVIMSQILQAEAVKVAMEAHRRAKPYCMGSLFWQINDCWPVASWSSIDYYGRWKALQYYARRAFAEVLVSPFKDERGDIVVRVVSDRTDALDGRVIVTIMTLDGEVRDRKICRCKVSANTIADAMTISRSDLERFGEADKLFIHVVVEENGRPIAENDYFDLNPKEYDLPDVEPVITIAPIEGGFRLNISSEKLIRGFCFPSSKDMILSDNFVTIVPQTVYKIDIKTRLSIDELQNRLVYTSINEIYK